MRAVLQRVERASVEVDGREIAAIGPGMLVLLGVAAGDSEADAEWTARKLAEVRIFADAAGRFNRGVSEVGGAALVVSQFTLLGDTRHGRRPGFTAAAPPEIAAPLVERVAALLRERGVPAQTGMFGAKMRVSLVNDGPVTLIFDSRARESS
ncbi:MAG TPA: D-aminoacyl-tRNA deacylase [Dehalococcoidia bacterium]|nr:D-aminoacyl-tRNA deacylase [Dehalococcoidia bacterium]